MKKVNKKSTSGGAYKNNSVKKEKNYKIQMVRAFAILMVVLSHTSPSGFMQIYCRPFCNLSVGIFLFLSGYLTKTENDDWKSFFKKRILKLIIPYLIWSVFFSIITYKGPINLIFNILTARAAAIFYYIFVYIQLVLLTPLLGKAAKSKYKWLVFLITPLSLIIFKYYYLLPGATMNTYVSIFWEDCCLGWISYYYLGLLLGNKLINLKISSKKVLILFLLSIPLQMLEGYILFKLGDTNCGTQMKFTCLITTLLFSLLTYYYITNDKYTYKNNFFVLCGNCSFGIYILHSVVIGVLKKIPIYSYIPYILNTIIVYILCLVIVIIANKILGNKIGSYFGLNI